MSDSTASDAFEWVDVFPLFKKASSACLSHTNPLLSSEGLDIFNLMNAAELMDPKLDQCYNVSKPRTKDENTLKICAYDLTNPYVYAGKDPVLCQLLSAIKVFNWLIINENSCFEGSAMLETLFYCKYTWLETWNRFDARHPVNTPMDPASAEYPQYLLVEYCKVLMMSMEHFTQGIVDADIFDDDDFQVQQPLFEIKDKHLPKDYQYPLSGGAGSDAGSSTAILASILAKGLTVNDMSKDVIKGAVQDSKKTAAAAEQAVTSSDVEGQSFEQVDEHLKPLAEIMKQLQKANTENTNMTRGVTVCLQYISLLFKYRLACYTLMRHIRQCLGSLSKFSNNANVVRSQASGDTNALAHTVELALLSELSVALAGVVSDMKQYYEANVLPLFVEEGLQGGMDVPLIEPEVEVLPIPTATVMCHPPVRINNYTLDDDIQYAFHIGLVRLHVNFPIRVVKHTVNTTACLYASLDNIANKIAGCGKATDFHSLSFVSTQLTIFEANADNLCLDDMVEFLQQKASSNTMHVLARSYVNVYFRALLASTITVTKGNTVSHYSVATSTIINSMCNSGIPREYILYQKEGAHELLGVSQTVDGIPVGTGSVATYSNSLLVNHVNKLVQYMCMSRAKLPQRLEANVFPFWGNQGAALARGADYYRSDQDQDVLAEVERGSNAFVKGELMPKLDFFFQWMGLQLGTFMDMYMALQIENDLVQTSELDYFYWYWDYLNNFKSYLMDQMKACRVAYEELFLIKSFDEKTRKLVAIKKRVGARPPSYYPNNAELYLKARGQVCRGYLRTMLLCSSLKVHKCTKFQSPFTSWEYRYWTRFKAFTQCATTSFLPYSDYMKAINDFGSIDAQTILSTAVTCFGNVRQYQDARKVLSEKQAADPDNFLVYCRSVGTPAMQAYRKQQADAKWKHLLKLAIMNSLNLNNLAKQLPKTDSPPPATAKGSAKNKPATPAAAVSSTYDLILDHTQDSAFPVCLISASTSSSITTK